MLLWTNETSEVNVMITIFESIIGQACSEFPDCKVAEYLLLIGRKEQNNLSWIAKIFDSSGKLLNQYYCGI